MTIFFRTITGNEVYINSDSVVQIAEADKEGKIWMVTTPFSQVLVNEETARRIVNAVGFKDLSQPDVDDDDKDWYRKVYDK